MIKKVVIPKTEVKWVCEISENTYNSKIEDSKVYISKSEFTKIETLKPLAENEVSLNDVSYNNIYAFATKSGKIELIKNKCLSTSFDYCQDLNCGSIELLIKSGADIYEFSDTKRQEEFFEWSLKQVRTVK